MNYKYEKHSADGMLNQMAASIKEIPSDQWIAIGLTVDNAKRLTRHLNFGGGFDGWTPSFFLNDVKIPD